MLEKLYDAFATLGCASEVDYRADSYFKVRIGKQLVVEAICVKADGFLVSQDCLRIQYGEQVIFKELFPSGLIAERVYDIIKHIERLVAHSLYFESRVAGCIYGFEHEFKGDAKCYP